SIQFTKYFATALVLATLGAVCSASAFETLNLKERAAKARWIAAKFDGVAEQIAPEKSGIEVIRNNDLVLVDRRFENKLRIAKTTFDKGLYCHANSELVVLLSKPAARFSAVVGIDTNAESTAGGAGSVHFVVKRGDSTLWRSELLRGAEEGVGVDVALSGAKKFSLVIDDGGDGISCDQADWADAKITYEDGEVAYLSNLELFDNGTYDRTFDVEFPFSFVYGGKSSREFLKDWKLDRQIENADGKVVRTLTFTEPDGPLQVVCSAIDYVDYPFVEWTLRFKNLSATDETPIIENIQTIDAIFGRDAFERAPFSGWDPECGAALRFNERREFKLHYSVGSPCRIDDYMPLTKTLNPGDAQEIATSGGRPTNAHLPYFNLESFEKGWIIVLGWSGQWTSKFERLGEL
ncbi:MAG: NPCBM/NEW2 domain-containing protein, partial [Thermoguttaceae bacterium]|nr:NPCBM/NEW2 domain-containing protein [Thermoguttaceae bacterium]